MDILYHYFWPWITHKLFYLLMLQQLVVGKCGNMKKDISNLPIIEILSTKPTTHKSKWPVKKAKLITIQNIWYHKYIRLIYFVPTWRVNA